MKLKEGFISALRYLWRILFLKYGPSSASFLIYSFQGFLHQWSQLHNLTIKEHIRINWGWLRFRAYPNNGRESWVGITAPLFLGYSQQVGEVTITRRQSCRHDALVMLNGVHIKVVLAWNAEGEVEIVIGKFRNFRGKVTWWRSSKIEQKNRERNFPPEIRTGVWQVKSWMYRKVKKFNRFRVKGLPGCTGFVVAMW